MRKTPQHVREEQINEKLSNTNYTFVKWTNGFKDNKSKVTISCPSHGEWSTLFRNIQIGRGCGKCHIESTRMNVAIVKSKIISKLKIGQTLIGVKGEYTSNQSKFNVKCVKHGLWSTSALHLIHSNSGCPKCGNDTVAKKRRTPYDTVINRIHDALDSVNHSYIGMYTEYVNSKSKIVLNCEKHGEWVSDISTVLSHRSGCPSCSKNGYDSKLKATLYILRSECGRYFKAGISNNFDRRLIELKRVTPFEFNVVGNVNSDGNVVLELERAFHSSFISANMKGFHGCTEWFKWSNDVMSWLRLL